MGTVSMEQVWRHFGAHVAVADLNLTVDDGQFLVLLGPSGCGKTTSLRMLAGLETPTAGLIRIDGQVVNDVRPGQRDISMVFQSYALYPHMNVYRNLVFGPRIRGEDRGQTHKAVLEVAEILGLGQLLERRPSELSGGQRQRVALGRALLRHPKLFLMDEPLSNLDAALRGQVRAELVRLHRKFGVTTVYVTHDQVEAMTMADKIAIMSHGRLQQAGTPQDVFDNPQNLTVATFIGSPPMNILEGTLSQEGDRLVVRVLGSAIVLPPWARASSLPALPAAVKVGVRPTDIAISQAPLPQVPSGRVGFAESLGAETYLSVTCEGAGIVCRASGRMRLNQGETIAMRLDPDYLYLFDPQTGASLLDRSARDQAAAPDKGRRTEMTAF